MNRLATHIEYTLKTQESVIIPSLGELVLRNIPATYDKETNIFSPMQKTLSFVPDLKLQGGLLVKQYENKQGISSEEATKAINSDVSALKEELQMKRSVTFGEIGTFTLGDEDQLLFTPNKNAFFNKENAFLSPIKIQTAAKLLEAQQQGSQEKRRTDKRKKRKYYIVFALFLILCTLATIAYFLFVPTTTTNDAPLSEFTTQTQTPNTTTKSPTIKEESAPNTNKQESIADTTQKETKENSSQKTTEQTPIQTASHKKYYYTVIASFPKEEEAKQYIEELGTSTFPDINYVKGSKRIRVYTKRFQTQGEAHAHLKALHATKKYKDAWIMIRRP